MKIDCSIRMNYFLISYIVYNNPEMKKIARIKNRRVR
nr:MAG TPA: hypothetical protein [Caudoviricetes sp.]